MSSLAFRKGDSPSCLVVDKTWEDIINKPSDFNELVTRLLEMIVSAEETGLMGNSSTFSQVKAIVNKVLLCPLQKELHIEESGGKRQKGTVLADAFWDEIIFPTESWASLKDALQRAYEMKQQIEERTPLSSSSTLKDIKDNFNGAILKPLLGITQSED